MDTLMAHMVSHFPDRDRALAVAEGLVRGGASYLEIQFPFSDPTADGPVIQAACQQALDNGFTVDDGLGFVDEVHRTFGVPVFIMSYANLVFARGIRKFLEDGVRAGAAGFILPDFPVDYDEGVYRTAAELGTTVMPVVVTTMNRERLDLLASLKPEYVYVAIRGGITGSRTEIGEENIAFLDMLSPLNARVMAGFGISERNQVETLAPHVHGVIVGSALVKAVGEAVGKTVRSGIDPESEEAQILITSRVADRVRALLGE